MAMVAQVSIFTIVTVIYYFDIHDMNLTFIILKD